MGTINTVLQMYRQTLQQLYSLHEADEFVRLCAYDYLNISFNDFDKNKQQVLTDSQYEIFNNVLNKLATGKPYQQILGYEYFCGLKFKVTKAVLTPRPETEELVEMAFEICKANNYNAIADFGTGSGCIAIAMQHKMPNLKVSGYDISYDALSIANHNNALVNNKVQFSKYDILCCEPALKGKYDMLISNPPYIPVSESANMHSNVVNFEPEIALFTSDDNPNIFYQKLGMLGKNILNHNGFILFEIHYLAGKAVSGILEHLGYKSIEVIKSIFGHDRFVKAQWVDTIV